MDKNNVSNAENDNNKPKKTRIGLELSIKVE